MTDKAPDRDFHDEIDDAIDNLFSPRMGSDLGKPAETPSLQPVAQAAADPAPVTTAPVPGSLLSVDGTDAFAPFDEALLSLDWEISPGNIEKARSALKEIQGFFEVDKAVALTEIFALMDRLLEVMAIAPQSVSTSAPKTLQEGLQTLRVAAGADDLSLVEKTLIDPTLSELRSAIPNIPKDYSKLGQTAQPKTQGVSGIEQKTEAAAVTPVQSVPTEEDVLPELPVVAPSGTSAAVLIETVNGHIAVLGKCIAKRIVPIENLFAKTPGYEKLHAIHTELRERMERQKQNLIKALGVDYQADAPLPLEPAAGQSEKSAVSTAAACPWQNVALASWGGKKVGFLPEQIVYQKKPAERVRKCGSFLPMKKLKRGLFGKISFVVQGELSFRDEATLNMLTIPVANPSGAKEYTPRADSPLLILFKENSGMAFWLDEPTEQFDTSTGCRWEPVADPTTLVAGNLTVNGEIVPVITMRGM
ncbi:MAG: hypothetical protein OEV89_07880 [Desulfobulbaceae bacterium]|nr:hypothetical protein [Desulfobulbaceae bacterium]HIJ90671.1 hypothetical protein [Deltaproteobacteria bacterium]